MQYKMPRGRPPWLRKAFIFYSLNEYNYPTCIGLRPENSLGTFPEQLEEKIQFTIACFYTN